MNETSPWALGASVVKNAQLIRQITKREVIGRYRGSILGLAWSFFYPLLMLAVYTFVFGVAFKARWAGDANSSKASFSLIIFSGLIVHGFVAEVMLNSPNLITANKSYVKRVIFPLEILSVSTVLTAMIHASISYAILVIFAIIVNGSLPWTACLVPLVLLPLAIACVGIGWILESLGTFVPDTGQVVGIFVSVLLFLSPIFFPLSSLSPKVRSLVSLNPLSFFIEQSRGVLIFGVLPDWLALGEYLLGGALVFCLGFWWFQKTRKGFADVL